MAAVAFDPLAYTHELEASGVSRQQAEVHAKAMTTMFLHNVDALVTRDYLDTRFTEFENRVEANIDRRFTELDKRFVAIDERFADNENSIDARFTALENSIDGRFSDLENSIDGRFSNMETYLDKRLAEFRLEMHGYIAELKGTQRLQSWMLAVVMTGVFMPLVQGYFA